MRWDERGRAERSRQINSGLVCNKVVQQAVTYVECVAVCAACFRRRNELTVSAECHCGIVPRLTAECCEGVLFMYV